MSSKLASHTLNNLFKSLLIISALLIYLIYICSFNTNNNSWFHTFINNPTKTTPNTNPSHIVFGIAATASTWSHRKHYVQSWWRPNITRGYVFLDKIQRDLLPWPNHTLPPFRISQDTSKYRHYDRHRARQAIRMALIISEAFDTERPHGGVRWFVMADDDTVVFVENLVEVLRRYDHRKYLYIGMNAETHASNVMHSFDMAFGGAGYALSYPLAKALAANMDACLKRYPTLYGSDHIVQSCVADLGVSITRHHGFHQIDLHHDISGFLSSHARAPLVSLHHLDEVDPIFPSMSCNDSLKHLMTAAKADESRLLQQSICYHKPKNWTFAISWGYSVHVYEAIVNPSALQRPLQTFVPWTKFAHPFFVFNTRLPSKHPCDAPHQFFFHSVGNGSRDHVVTRYSRARRRALPACSFTGNHSAESVASVVVISPAAKYHIIENRRECCDVLHVTGGNATELDRLEMDASRCREMVEVEFLDDVRVNFEDV
ncbi:uncharacterized protein LOC130988715 [Salvia miltiorrhiza]|uniref:uncharacterized protein LOC130988715 n=1 Tax=Salvia miltiorrhiza TaxID=226208 RepID=UPI0025AD82C2|nr:uncharacterized protein LOC130988715 [Salvia miltiorrhiza]